MRMCCAIVPAVALVLFATAAPTRSQDQSSTPDTAAVAAGLSWKSSIAEARAQAGTKDTQLLLFFKTEWCGFCRAMEESTFSDPRFAGLSSRLIFVRIDAEADTLIAGTYRLRGYPTAVLTTTNGQEVDRFAGYRSAAQLYRELSDAMDGKGTLWDLEKQLKTSPNDPAVLVAMGREYIERGQADQALQRFQQAINGDKKNQSGKIDDALFSQARMQRDDRNWYKAAEGFRRLIKDYPESEWREDAELYIPWLYVQAGDSTEALKRYRGFLKDFSGSSEVEWVKRQITRLENAAGERP